MIPEAAGKLLAAGVLCGVAWIGVSATAQQPAAPLAMPTPQVVVSVPFSHGRGLFNYPPEVLSTKIQGQNAKAGVQALRDQIRQRAAAPVPSAYTYPFQADVKNQGQKGTCWDFGSNHALRDLYKAAGQDINPSEQFVLNHINNGYGCNGGDVTFDFLTKTGTASEADCPYSTGFGCTTKDSAVPVYKLANWGYVGNDSNIPSDADLKAAILAHGPLAVGVAAGGEWDSYQGGNAVITGGWQVNHEVVIEGWDDSKSAWLVANSWGSSWGNNGRCWVGYGTGQIGTGAAFASINAPAPTPAPVPVPVPPSPVPTPSPGPTPDPSPSVLTNVIPVYSSDGFAYFTVQASSASQFIKIPAAPPAQLPTPVLATPYPNADGTATVPIFPSNVPQLIKVPMRSPK